MHSVQIDASPDASSDETNWYAGAAALLVPGAAVVALDPAGWFPFSVAKWTAVACASLVAVATSCRTRRYRPPMRAERAAWLLMVLLVAIVVVSAIDGVGGRSAWFGTPIRHLGALTWVLFAAMFAVGRRLGTSRRSVERVSAGMVGIGLLLGVYVLFEFVFGAPVDVVTASSRLGGSFGSASYLGAGACLFAPIAVAEALDPDGSDRLRRSAGVASVLLGFALLGSGSRSALVGVSVSAALVVIAKRVATRDRSGLEWPGVSPVAAMAWAVGGVSAVVVAIASGVFERGAGVTSRLDEWRVAMRVVGDHPELGVGPEGYRLVVGGAVDPDYVRDYGESVGIDRAHNGVLDVAVSSGVAAAIIAVALLAVVVWLATRLVRRGSTTEVGIAAAVVAYAVQQQFLFPVAELDPTFWMLAGIVVVRATTVEAVDVAARGTSLAQRVRPVVAATAAVVMILGAVTVGYFGVRTIAADRAARDATRNPDPGRALASAERAVQLSPADVRYRILVARAHGSDRSLAGVDQAIADVDAALDVEPSDPDALLEHARLVSLRASVTGADIDWSLAADEWDGLTARWSACARCRVGSAMVALERDDDATARRNLLEAERLGDPEAGLALDRLGRN